MRICHIITRLIIGGAQENTLLSVAGLADRGHDVTLIAGPETGPEGSLWSRARATSATIVELDSLRRNPHPLRDLSCQRRLVKILRSGRFDVVHTHSSKAGILGRRAAGHADVPVVVHTIHGMSFNRTQSLPVRWFYRTLERRAANQTDAFITVADAMTDQAVAAGIGSREVFHTVYSGIETERYVPTQSARDDARQRWNVGPNDVVVGTIARLFRNKGYDQLIEAIPLAIDRVGALRFVWVGDGPDRQRYLDRVAAMGVGDRVHHTGLVSPDDIPGLIAGFDILVHASKWEGLPRALVQALLMEVPVVSFDNDGAPEVVHDNETGILAPYGDTRRLADGIVKLAESESLRRKLGHAGRAYCLDRFSEARMVDGLLRVYERLLSSRRR